MKLRARLLLALLLGSLLAVVGAFGHGQLVPAARAQVQADTFVGKLSGMDAFIGIGSDGFNVTAYVCDGANNNVGDNFQGTADQASDGVLALQADNGDVLYLYFDQTTLPGMLVPGGNITGTLVTTDGNSYPFSTDAAVSPGGLFLADSQAMPDGTPADGGWVVLNDGEVRGSFSLPGINFGHSGVLGVGIQFAPSVAPQLSLPQLPMFGQNLNQVFLGGGGNLTLPVLNRPVMFILIVRRFRGHS